MDKINININKDDPSINDYLFCIKEFGEIPNRISIFNTYKIDKFNEFISGISSSNTISKEVIPTGSDYIINQKNFVKISNDIYLSFVEYDKVSELGIITDLIIFYRGSDDEVNKLIESLSAFSPDIQGEDMQQKFNLLTTTTEGIQLDPIDILDSDYEHMDLYYNDIVIKRSKKLTKLINKNKKGLSIIYGERGVGKTSLISSMILDIDRICIFIPANMIDITISSNEFKAIIKRYRNSIIVIDDCEIFFSHAYTKSNIFTNNLLQMVDGISSDSDGLHIICVLNTDDINDIDPTLLDCNNFMDILEVTRLHPDKVNDLCKHLKQKNKFKNPRLIDVLKKRRGDSNINEMGF